MIFFGLTLLVVGLAVGFGLGLWVGLEDLPEGEPAPSPVSSPVEAPPVPAPVPKTVIVNRPIKIIERWLKPEPVAPPPVVVEPPAPVAPVKQPIPSLQARIKLIDEKDRLIAVKSIPAEKRRHKLNFPCPGGMGVFQACHQEKDGTWVYRRVELQR